MTPVVPQKGRRRPIIPHESTAAGPEAKARRSEWRKEGGEWGEWRGQRSACKRLPWTHLSCLGTWKYGCARRGKAGAQGRIGYAGTGWERAARDIPRSSSTFSISLSIPPSAIRDSMMIGAVCGMKEATSENARRELDDSG